MFSWNRLKGLLSFTLHFFYFYSIFIFVINYTATFKKDRVNSWSSVCPHGIYFFLGSCLFQFFKDLVRAHATCQQLLQHSLCLDLLSFLSGLRICLCLLRFQRCHFFFGLLQSSLAMIYVLVFIALLVIFFTRSRSSCALERVGKRTLSIELFILVTISLGNLSP